MADALRMEVYSLEVGASRHLRRPPRNVLKSVKAQQPDQGLFVEEKLMSPVAKSVVNYKTWISFDRVWYERRGNPAAVFFLYIAGVGRVETEQLQKIRSGNP